MSLDRLPFMLNDFVELGGRRVGPGEPPFMIAEIAQAHEGSVNMAHSFIDAIADAGADAVKFQTHIAAAESTPSEPWRVRFSHEDATRYNYWRRMEFKEEHWAGLKKHAEDRHLIFLSSPFSPEAVELLQRLGVPGWKVASGEVSNLPLLRQLAATRLPVLLSSGMSREKELDAAVQLCREAGAPVALFQCSTIYPCPPEKVGLNLLQEFKAKYGCPVGLSDHSGKIFAGLAAVALGASLIEVHVTFSRQMFGPDVPASLTFEELKQLTQGAREIFQMLKSPVAKEALAEEMEPLRRIFQKSIVTRSALPAGALLQAEHLALKKAGGGLPPDALEAVLGKKLTRSLEANTPLQPGDFTSQETNC